MTLATRGTSGRLSRTSAIAASFAVVITTWVALAPAAQADPGLGVTGTSVTNVETNATTPLTGLSVTGAGASDDIQVIIGTDIGTLTVNDTTGVTLAYGNNASGDPEVSFDGLPADVNNALASIDLVTDADGGDATVSITAMPMTPGLVFAPGNGHFYQYVPAPAITWDDAKTAAEALTFGGQAGYLASIPSELVNAVLTSKIEGAENVWIGAESTDDPFGSPARAWHWSGGPLDGTVMSQCSNWENVCDFTPEVQQYDNWAWGEPNNANGGVTPHSGEWVAVTNWMGPYGEWNDLPADAVWGISGYVVEYGDQVDGSTGFTGVATTSSTVEVRGVPSAPQNPWGFPGNKEAVLQWDVPAHNGGSPITGYTVTVLPGGRTVACDSSPCTVTGLTNGTTYRFTVHATNAIGDSPESDRTFGITPFLGFPAPVIDTVTSGDRAMTVMFNFGVVRRAGVPDIVGFRYTVDHGKTWKPMATDWEPRQKRPSDITGTIEGTLNGHRYAVQIAAKTSEGLGTPSRAYVFTTKAWFHDPLTPAARKALKAVPGNPAGYHGKVARTKAFAASRNGAPAFPAADLKGRQLQQGQAVSFAAGEMFRFDSAVVTPTGRREIRAVLSSLTYVKAVQCEGYSDYGGSVANEWKLSRARAAAVCRLMNKYGADVTTDSKGFGPTRPAIIGGSTAARDDNRRVVLVING
jgi:outer membrane protein OmpA-like peptidoglycan-associated protein